MRLFQQIRGIPTKHKIVIGTLAGSTIATFSLTDQPTEALVTSGIRLMASMLNATALLGGCAFALALAKCVYDALQDDHIQKQISDSATAIRMVCA